MTIEHVDITTGEIHEPKGQASANAGEVYVADGLGSGNHIRYQGWGQYEDTDTTVGTPSQTLTAATRTKWTNDGGALTLEKNPSDLLVPMWDTTNNKHVPIAEFDIYHLRMGFYAENYAGSSPYIDMELDIGGSVGVIFGRGISLRKGGAAQFISISFPVFTGSTYFANGGEIYLTYQGTGTCDIYKSSILVIRESKNYV